MNRLAILALLLTIPACGGCAPVLIGALMYDHVESRKDKREFTESFNKQNLEREKAGLKPLDWCSELYSANQSWYSSDARCKKA